MIILYIILAVLILLLMITIHELGHYTAGKLLGFGINEFSVGLGPKIISKRLKTGEEVSLRALPLGGYCAFSGEDDGAEAKENDDSLSFDNRRSDIDKTEKSCSNEQNSGEKTDKQDSVSIDSGRHLFFEQKPWKRIIVLLMGPLFNLLSAFVFSFIYILAVGYAVPVITDLSVDPVTGEPYAVMFEVGDVITAINGEKITFLKSSNELFSETNDDANIFTIERDGKELDIVSSKHQIGEDKKFGFTLSYESRSVNVVEAVGYSFPYTFELSWLILRSFGMLLTGGVSVTDMTGPVGTVATIATYAQSDPRYFLLFLPLIASNLAIFNLLPFPALDGARIVFTAIEWVRGKPINKKVEGMIHAIGLIVLIVCVIVIDIIGMAARYIL